MALIRSFLNLQANGTGTPLESGLKKNVINKKQTEKQQCGLITQVIPYFQYAHLEILMNFCQSHGMQSWGIRYCILIFGIRTYVLNQKAIF